MSPAVAVIAFWLAVAAVVALCNAYGVIVLAYLGAGFGAVIVSIVVYLAALDEGDQ